MDSGISSAGEQKTWLVSYQLPNLVIQRKITKKQFFYQCSFGPAEPCKRLEKTLFLFNFVFPLTGHQQNANTTASASPPLTAQPSPLTPEEQHRELDDLLNDMMLTVQSIPDLKPQHRPDQHHQNNFGLDDVRYIDETEDDKNIPYHARQDSRPFSYSSNAMIADAKAGLSSPSLVRKASLNRSSGDTLNKVQTQVIEIQPSGSLVILKNL